MEPGVNVVPELIVKVSIVTGAPSVVVPPVIFKILKLVNIVAGNVLVAVNSTVPKPAVNVLDPAFPNANPEQINFPPLVIVNAPLLFVAVGSPNVTVPETVN